MKSALQRCVVLLFGFMAFGANLFGATPPDDPRSDAERLYYFHIANAVRETDASRKSIARDDLADIADTNKLAFMYYALPPGLVKDSFKEFLISVEKSRVDQQIGPAGGSTGSIVKTGLITLFGFGLDSSDAVHTIDQGTATLRGNVGGLSRFFSNQEVIPACSPTDRDCIPPQGELLRNLEVGVSFSASDPGTRVLHGLNPSNGDDVEFTTNIHKRQFNSASFRYSVDNQHDLHSPEYRERWIRWFQANEETLKSGGREVLEYIKVTLQQAQQVDSNGKLTRDSGAPDLYTVWLAETREKLKNVVAGDERAWEAALSAQLDTLLVRLRKVDRDFDNRLAELAKAYIRRLTAGRDPYLVIVTAPAMTLEYSYSEPLLQPKVHTLKLAYAYSPKGRGSEPNAGVVTINLGMDFNQDAQVTTTTSSHWRGMMFGMQFDRPFGKPDSTAQLSIGGYYEYLHSQGAITLPPGATGVSLPPVGTVLLTPKGSIFSAHATMILRIANNGIKLPIGLSWASRTDLSRDNEVRGHIGFTFDSLPLLLMSGSR